jgi:hypothetical protein
MEIFHGSKLLLLAEAVEKVVCSVRLDVIPLATDLAGGYGDDG